MAIDPNWVRENPEEAARKIELLTIERDQYRAAEEKQIALRVKAVESEQAMGAALEEHAALIRDLQQHHLADKKGRRESNRLANRLLGISHVSATASLYKRDLIKKAEALENLLEVIPGSIDHDGCDFGCGRIATETAAQLRRWADGA